MGLTSIVKGGDDDLQNGAATVDAAVLGCADAAMIDAVKLENEGIDSIRGFGA